jgi:hypothetical protein
MNAGEAWPTAPAVGDDALLRESDALHDRVRSFARRFPPGARADAGEFDRLAVDVARYQARYNEGSRRLLEASGGTLVDAASIPAVPVVAFRMARVATHAASRDAAVFHTSGTTDARPGKHPMRTTGTYRAVSLAHGRSALLSPAIAARRRTVVALAPEPGDAPTSSLGWMMRAFAEDFDGRPLAPSGHFLAGPNGVDIEALERAVHVATSREEPLLVLATGFALVLLTDALGGRSLAAPPGTVVMPTGGFKARTREVERGELVSLTASAFGIDDANVVGEYGMTELTSQLYEGTLPGGIVTAPRGTYVPPPWLRVTAVDPETLRPVPPGEAGMARFVDLGNVDSAVAVVTEDLIRERGLGIELLGRRQGAEARGCSLAIEQMVLGGTP